MGRPNNGTYVYSDKHSWVETNVDLLRLYKGNWVIFDMSISGGLVIYVTKKVRL